MKASYGQIELAGKFWVIQCEAHVRIRLKRVFGGVRKSAYDEVKLADSPETCRELLWFCDRYPMEITPRDYMQEQSDRHEREEQMVFEMVSGHVPPAEFDLALPLRDYQRIATDLALKTGGLLVADDVGLGKTACAIGVFTDLRTLPALVVTLTHLPIQWQRELNRFAPKLSTHIVKKGTPYDIKGGWPDVLIMNYHKLAGWADVLANRVRSVVFDEIQELRTGAEKSAKGAAANHIAKSVGFRMGLSATPIYNHGFEMFNVMECVRPGALGPEHEFRNEWVDNYGRVKDPQAFGTYLRDAGMMLRRTREDVQRELRPLTKVPHWISADFDAMDKVARSADELALAIVNPADLNQKDQFGAEREFNSLLRQATGVAKAPYVAEFVRMLLDRGEQVVLYGWHRVVYSLWLDRLKDYRPAMYTGSESPKQKDEAIQRFMDRDARVLLISLRSGAGLDGLQHHTRTVVFGELDWSPGVHEQCLSDDTEVLTRSGFCGRDDVEVGDEIAAFDLADSSIRWTPAQSKTDRPMYAGERMYAAVTEKTALRVTGEHRLVVRRSTRTTEGRGRSPWEIVLAQSVAGATRRFIPTCGFEDAPGVDLTDYELRLIGWFVTDGSFNGRFVTIFQAAHQPWNEDLVEVLDGCDLTWHRYTRQNPSGPMNLYCIPKGTLHRWSRNEVDRLREMLRNGLGYKDVSTALNRSAAAVGKKARKLESHGEGMPVAKRTVRGWLHLHDYLDKDLSPLLEQITRKQLIQLLRGIYMGDGAKSPKLKNVTRITSVNKLFMDRLQSLCVRRGFSATISRRKAKTSAGNTAYDIFISEAADASLPGANKRNGFAESPRTDRERVWCVTNEMGTLITRRNGKVAIVGNCIGRVHRDGQLDPVTAYYLLAEVGVDPFMSKVLGIKRTQIEGIKDPTGAAQPNYDVAGDSIKQLARDYLEQRKKTKGTEHAGNFDRVVYFD